MSCKYCENKKELYYEMYDKELNMYIQAQISDGVMYLEDNYTEREFEINYCPICGERLSDNFISIQHMQLSKKDYDKLVDKYTQEVVHDTIDSLANYNKAKKYKSAYLTLNKWCKKRVKQDDGWGGIK